MQEKIFSYLDDISEAYQESVQVVQGLTHNMREVLNTIEFYSNDEYLSGNTDSLGREKPFYNICNFRVTVAKTATDLDVKDLKFEADSLKYSVQNMIINRELFKYLKESNFSLLLNKMGHTRPKYGGVIVKKYMEKGKLDIDVVEWANVEVDPSNILGGAVIETHYMETPEFASMADVWDNVVEVLKAHTKAHKGKPVDVEVKEITGNFPEYYFKGVEETDKSKYTFKGMCSYIAVVNKKKYLLHQEYVDVKDKYKYLAWQEVPKRGLGRGIVEDGFNAQWATNDSMLSIKSAMELSGKVLIATDSNKISGNVLTDADNGRIYQMEQGRSMTSLNLGATALPEFNNVIELWKSQYNNAASTYDANTGEAPTAGTPYSQTALLNQVANSPFEYRREEWGIFLNEILNDWILPYLKKKIIKEHNLVAEYDNDELDVIDEAISTYEANKETKKRLLNNEMVSKVSYDTIKASLKNSLQVHASKREVKIPAGFLDVEGHITANITGELKNKQAMLQSLDSVLKTIISTFNPNTGTYLALEDKTLSRIFGTIVELSGVPISSAQLKSGGQAMPQQPQAPADMSAITNIAPTLSTKAPATA
jgi:hypothetical protein